MTYGRKHKRRAGPLSLLIVLALVVPVVAGGLASTWWAADAAPDTGAELVSIGRGEDEAAGGSGAQVSADGRHVVFQSRRDLSAATPLFPRSGGSSWRVYGRDLETGALTLLSDPDVDATEPQVSRDGRTVVYRSGGRLLDQSRRTSIVAVDRDTTGVGALDRPGTMKASDLGAAPGPVPSSFPGRCGEDCGPRISGDGSVVAYPSVLSPVSPGLVLTAGTNATFDILVGATIDFGVFGNRPQGFSATDAPVTVTLGTKSLVPEFRDADITGQPVLQSTGTREGGDFSIAPKQCTAEGFCRVAVTFRPAGCAGQPAVTDRLSTNGPTSYGQASVVLLASCARPAPEATCERASGPTEREMAQLPLRRGVPAAGGVVGTRLDLPPVQPGRPFLVWVPADGMRGRLGLFTQDCAAISLVDPGPEVREAARRQGASRPGAVLPGRPGDVLDGASGADTLYFLVNPAPGPDRQPTGPDRPFPPGGAQTYAAQVTLDRAAGTGDPQGGFSVTVRAERQVVEVRRDLRPGGGFEPGPAGIAGRRGSAGGAAPVVVDGGQPALSEDGRTLVFTSRGLPGTPPHSSTVLAASADTDTDTGTGTGTDTGTGTGTGTGGRYGSATAVSGASGGETAASAPAVSADGSTVAYVSAPGPSAPRRPAQVVVADRQGGEPRTVSAGASGRPGNGDSGRPALSPDGRVVGFASTATDLTADPPPAGPQLYARTVASGAYPTHLAALDPAERASGPAVSFDAHGVRVALSTPESLHRDDRNQQPDVYTWALPGRLTVIPARIDFGTFDRPSGTGRGMPLTVGNSGPGPLTVTGATPSASFGFRSACVGRTLDAGESCTGVVSFTPSAAGRYEGTVDVVAATGSDRRQQRGAAGLRAVVDRPAAPEPGPSAPSDPPSGGPAPGPSRPPADADGPGPSPSGGGHGGGHREPPPRPSVAPEPPPGPSPAPELPPPGAGGVLRLSPTVAHPGRVSQVYGSGFAAGARIHLTWGTTGPVRQVTASARGTFTAYLPVADGAGQGRGEITATAGGRLLAAARFLVGLPSVQPPFLERRS
ncbi:hypothetical protein [Streptomyces sp. NPDC055094]